MRRRVHEPALGPEGVDAPGEAERRVHADAALEDLAVIADVLDDTGGEVGGQAETCIERGGAAVRLDRETEETPDLGVVGVDRKSTRLNSSHVKISYAVFCLKKK